MTDLRPGRMNLEERRTVLELRFPLRTGYYCAAMSRAITIARVARVFESSKAAKAVKCLTSPRSG